ncbi:MAG: response regulator [Thermodesulfovibrionales bacterium]
MSAKQDSRDTAGRSPKQVLVVDDEHVIRMLLSSFLGEMGVVPLTASTAEEGLALLEHTPVDIALVDIRLGGMTGIQMLGEIKKISPETEVIIITSHASLETAIEAIRMGAYDYLIKPFDDLEVIWLTLQRAMEKRQLTLKNEQLLMDLERRNDELSKTVGRLTSLINAGRAMSAMTNLPELLDHFVELVCQELRAERVSLMLLDRETNELRIAASRGLSVEIVQKVRVKVGEGIAGRVASMGKPFFVKDIRSDPRMRDRVDPSLSDSFMSLPIVLSIPIKLNETILGVINATNKRLDNTFSEDDLAFLYGLAGQAAVAIENARHFNELQTAYESLKASQAQLVASERLNALGEMAAGVAHDFNNILCGVLGRAQLLLQRVDRGTNDSETLKANLKIVEHCALQGAETVRRIQSFTCIRRDVPSESVDLNEVVRDAVQITRHKWKNEREACGASITIQMDLREVSPAQGISRELVQAVSNLIFNAVEAMPGGGTLKLSTAQEENAVRLEVADSGTGIDEDVQNRIFEPFFTTKDKGNGLGLSVVYGIVAGHGGEISFSSKAGGGTTFSVKLPARLPAQARPAGDIRLQTVFSRSVKIMVVEDDKIIRELIYDVLQESGHQVTIACSGEEGLSLFNPGVFDLIITDLSLESMSGLELARRFKHIDPRIRIMLCSGWALQQREEEVKEAGIDVVLQKPIDMADLLRAVERSLQSPKDSESICSHISDGCHSWKNDENSKGEHDRDMGHDTGNVKLDTEALGL